MNRRAVLKAAGALTAGSVVGSVPASADHERTEPPNHVSLEFDEDVLNDWRPRLVTRHLNVKPSKQYAWTATSPDHDTDAHCYWTWYVTQEGLTGWDSHYLDREPVYVFVQNGEISEVVYSGYHWLAARDRSPQTDLDGHPTFEVVERWHHYVQTGDDTGELVELDDLDDVFSSWLANGWEEDLEPGTAQNPWLMASTDSGAGRSSWWRENDVLGVSLAAVWKRLQLRLRVRGGRESDLT